MERSVAGIFEVTNDVFCQPEGDDIVLDRSQLWILTPGINQSSRSESGKYSSLVFVSMAYYGLAVRGLQLVAVLSRLVMEKMIPTPSQVKILIQTSQHVLCPIESSIFVCFFSGFYPKFNEICNQPRVIESVTRSVPVEQLHKHAEELPCFKQGNLTYLV